MLRESNTQIGGGNVTGDDGASHATAPAGRTPHVAKTASPEMATPGERANAESMPSDIAPALQPIGLGNGTGVDGHSCRDIHATTAINAKTQIGPEKVRRKRANSSAPPQCASPASEFIDPVSNDEVGGEGLSNSDTQYASALATPETRLIVNQLVALQKRRRFCIKEKNGSESRIEHLLVGAIGMGETEKDKKAAFARARAYRLAVERSGEGQPACDTQWAIALSAFDLLILQSAAGRMPWSDLRKKCEHEMEALAKRLPIASFVKSVRGFGMLSFAVVQAETGLPIAEYRSVSGLWKHMGLAVIDGHRQKGVKGKRKDEEEARRLFHPKERRGEIYTCFQDSMFRAQWNGERLNCVACGGPRKFKWNAAGTPICEECSAENDASNVILAHASGPYGEIYARRRTHTAARIIETDGLAGNDPDKWSAKRCHNDATRIMTKALLRDLWRVSRGLPPRGSAASE